MKKSRGAVSIEFSLLFIPIFLLFYGIIGYSAPLVLAASYQQVAADALREAIGLHFEAAERFDAQESVLHFIDNTWLPDAWARPCDGYGENFLLVMDDTWSVCLRHERPEDIIPPFRIFGWRIPELPDQILGQASIRIR